MIQNDFDLMSLIRCANNGYDFQKTVLTFLKRNLGTLAISSGFDFIVSGNHQVNLAFHLIFNTGLFIGATSIVSLINDFFKEEGIELAHLMLIKLALELQTLDINTTPDLLKESEVIETNYIARINKSILPTVQQKKYVLIPGYDYDGKEVATSVLQEHDMNSQQWVLSRGKPKKALILVPSFRID